MNKNRRIISNILIPGLVVAFLFLTACYHPNIYNASDKNIKIEKCTETGLTQKEKDERIERLNEISKKYEGIGSFLSNGVLYSSEGSKVIVTSQKEYGRIAH